jgi:hypothetical protein
MAVIRCKGNLWRRLGGKRKIGPASTASIPGVMLGSWVAKAFECDGHDLILAVNERTYLTVLFPFVPRERLCSEMAAAVANALRDLGIAESIAGAESAAVEFMPLARLEGGELGAVLEDVQFECEIELTYHTDLRVVQRNLNDFPHPNRNPCVPLEAVRQLFRNVAEGPSWLRSTV